MSTKIESIHQFPIYTSQGGFKSLWQKYDIYRDRLVLNTLLFGKFVIKFENIVKVELRDPNVKLVWTEIWRYKSIHYALKLDIADFYWHLGVHRKTGWIKLLLFTPENPSLFKQQLEQSIAESKNIR